MVSASTNDQKYPRYPQVLKLNVTLARPLRLVILYFFKCKLLSNDRHLYLHDSKWNLRSDVDGPTHTKQLLNLLCIVYIKKMRINGIKKWDITWTLCDSLHDWL